MISIHPRALAGGAIVIVVAGLLYTLVPSGPAALLLSILGGLVAVVVASQSGARDPYGGLLPALRATRQGQLVEAPDGVLPELGRVYDELSRIAEIVGGIPAERAELGRLRERASADEVRVREL